MSAGIWAGISERLDRARDADALRFHGLQLLEARRLRDRGLPLAKLAEDVRRAAVVAVTAPVVLERARAAYDGPLVLLKGPELAVRYPDEALRPYHDLDVLVADAPAARVALLAAGFEPVGDPGAYVGIHHLQPLALPGLPLPLELHERPKWPAGFAPPATTELLAAAVPSATGLPGVLALPPAPHALVVAAHAWAHEPLRRALDVLDTALLGSEADVEELAALTERWGLGRIWRTTAAAADALLRGAPTPWSLQLWARHLPVLRERSVLESHLVRSLGPWWALAPRSAAAASAGALRDDVRREGDERWSEKLVRTRRALRDALAPRSKHDRTLRR